MSELTTKQERFVQEYLVDSNATQAAIRAGYSAKTASSQGERLLRNVEVSAAVAAGRQVLDQRREITSDETLRQLGRVGWGDLRKAFAADGRLLRPHEWDDDTAAFISSVEVVTKNLGEGEVEHVTKIRTSDRVAALANVARSLGMFKDSMLVNHVGVVFLSPQWQAVQGAILRALDPYPDARAAVLKALEAL